MTDGLRRRNAKAPSPSPDPGGRRRSHLPRPANNMKVTSHLDFDKSSSRPQDEQAPIAADFNHQVTNDLNNIGEEPFEPQGDEASPTVGLNWKPVKDVNDLPEELSKVKDILRFLTGRVTRIQKVHKESNITLARLGKDDYRKRVMLNDANKYLCDILKDKCTETEYRQIIKSMFRDLSNALASSDVQVASQAPVSAKARTSSNAATSAQARASTKAKTSSKPQDSPDAQAPSNGLSMTDPGYEQPNSQPEDDNAEHQDVPMAPPTGFGEINEPTEAVIKREDSGPPALDSFQAAQSPSSDQRAQSPLSLKRSRSTEEESFDGADAEESSRPTKIRKVAKTARTSIGNPTKKSNRSSSRQNVQGPPTRGRAASIDSVADFASTSPADPTRLLFAPSRSSNQGAAAVDSYTTNDNAAPYDNVVRPLREDAPSSERRIQYAPSYTAALGYEDDDAVDSPEPVEDEMVLAALSAYYAHNDVNADATTATNRPVSSDFAAPTTLTSARPAGSNDGESDDAAATFDSSPPASRKFASPTSAFGANDDTDLTEPDSGETESDSDRLYPLGPCDRCVEYGKDCEKPDHPDDEPYGCKFCNIRGFECSLVDPEMYESDHGMDDDDGDDDDEENDDDGSPDASDEPVDEQPSDDDGSGSPAPDNAPNDNGAAGSTPSGIDDGSQLDTKKLKAAQAAFNLSYVPAAGTKRSRTSDDNVDAGMTPPAKSRRLSDDDGAPSATRVRLDNLDVSLAERKRLDQWWLCDVNKTGCTLVGCALLIMKYCQDMSTFYKWWFAHDWKPLQRELMELFLDAQLSRRRLATTASAQSSNDNKVDKVGTTVIAGQATLANLAPAAPPAVGGEDEEEEL